MSSRKSRFKMQKASPSEVTSLRPAPGSQHSTADPSAATLTLTQADASLNSNLQQLHTTAENCTSKSQCSTTTSRHDIATGSSTCPVDDILSPQSASFTVPPVSTITSQEGQHSPASAVRHENVALPAVTQPSPAQRALPPLPISSPLHLHHPALVHTGSNYDENIYEEISEEFMREVVSRSAPQACDNGSNTHKTFSKRHQTPHHNAFYEAGLSSSEDDYGFAKVKKHESGGTAKTKTRGMVRNLKCMLSGAKGKARLFSGKEDLSPHRTENFSVTPRKPQCAREMRDDTAIGGPDVMYRVDLTSAKLTLQTQQQDQHMTHHQQQNHQWQQHQQQQELYRQQHQQQQELHWRQQQQSMLQQPTSISSIISSQNNAHNASYCSNPQTDSAATAAYFSGGSDSGVSVSSDGSSSSHGYSSHGTNPFSPLPAYPQTFSPTTCPQSFSPLSVACQPFQLQQQQHHLRDSVFCDNRPFALHTVWEQGADPGGEAEDLHPPPPPPPRYNRSRGTKPLPPPPPYGSYHATPAVYQPNVHQAWHPPDMQLPAQHPAAINMPMTDTKMLLQQQQQQQRQQQQQHQQQQQQQPEPITPLDTSIVTTAGDEGFCDSDSTRVGESTFVRRAREKISAKLRHLDLAAIEELTRPEEDVPLSPPLLDTVPCAFSRPYTAADSDDADSSLYYFSSTAASSSYSTMTSTTMDGNSPTLGIWQHAPSNDDDGNSQYYFSAAAAAQKTSSMQPPAYSSVRRQRHHGEVFTSISLRRGLQSVDTGTLSPVNEEPPPPLPKRSPQATPTSRHRSPPAVPLPLTDDDNPVVAMTASCSFQRSKSLMNPDVSITAIGCDVMDGSRSSSPGITTTNTDVSSVANFERSGFRKPVWKKDKTVAAAVGSSVEHHFKRSKSLMNPLPLSPPPLPPQETVTENRTAVASESPLRADSPDDNAVEAVTHFHRQQGIRKAMMQGRRSVSSSGAEYSSTDHSDSEPCRAGASARSRRFSRSTTRDRPALLKSASAEQLLEETGDNGEKEAGDKENKTQCVTLSHNAPTSAGDSAKETGGKHNVNSSKRRNKFASSSESQLGLRATSYVHHKGNGDFAQGKNKALSDLLRMNHDRQFLVFV